MLLMMILNLSLLIMIRQLNSYVTKETFLKIVLIQHYKSLKIQTRIRINHWKNGSSPNIINYYECFIAYFEDNNSLLFISFLFSVSNLPSSYRFRSTNFIPFVSSG